MALPSIIYCFRSLCVVFLCLCFSLCRSHVCFLCKSYALCTECEYFITNRMCVLTLLKQSNFLQKLFRVSLGGLQTFCCPPITFLTWLPWEHLALTRSKSELRFSPWKYALPLIMHLPVLLSLQIFVESFMSACRTQITILGSRTARTQQSLMREMETIHY